MFQKKSPRFAAAFVVTISAGCGSSTPPVDHGGSPEFVQDPDGKCYMRHPANPPFSEAVDCETRKPLPPEPPKDKPDNVNPSNPPPPVPPLVASTPVDKPVETPPKTPDPDLEPAPQGWRVDHEPDGSCRAYAPTGGCPKGARCNPPPPRKVKCP